MLNYFLHIVLSNVSFGYKKLINNKLSTKKWKSRKKARI